MSIKGRVAIVTGAGGDMGFAIAAALAGAGARVVLNDLGKERIHDHAAALNETVGERVADACAADITRQDDVNRLVAFATAAFEKPPTVLVNNAGLLFPTRIDAITRPEWDRVIAVNLTGPFLCSQAVIGGMRRERWGRIVNVSSSAGRSVSTLGGAHYTAAKAGVLGLTRALAKELTGDGICVNAVCPGLIDTAMVRDNCTADRIDGYAAGFPARRLGRPEEVAELVLFLCEHGDYVAGASIDINGGDLMI